MPYRRQVLRLHFRRQRFGLRHRSGMTSPIRLCGEAGLWFSVRLADDCRRGAGSLGEKISEHLGSLSDWFQFSGTFFVVSV